MKNSTKVERIFSDLCQITVNHINTKLTEKYIMILIEYLFLAVFCMYSTVSITV